MIGRGSPPSKSIKSSTRSTSTMMHSTRRGWTPSLLGMLVLLVAASWMIQESSASVMRQQPLPEARLLNIFKGLGSGSGSGSDSSDDGGDSSASAANEASEVSKAVSMAGSHSPTVSNVAVTGTGSVDGSSRVNLLATSTAGAVIDAAASSSTVATPTAAPSSSSSSIASASDKQGDETWSWAVGAFGCATGSASGTMQLCYETGKEAASPSSSSATPSATPSATDSASASGMNAMVTPTFDTDSLFEYVKRQSSSDTNNQSGNGGPPTDINNVNSPDLGWLDTVVGAVPYKNGDLAASIVWIIVTLMLIPLFLIRLLRRSSLIAHVLFTIFLWGCAIIAAFGVRAYMANNAPSTTLMITENIILQVLPNLLLEPLLSLLAMYSVQGGLQSGVPSVCLLLRFLNIVALVLFAVAGAYTGVYMHQWDTALLSPVDVAPRDEFPAYLPPNITRLGPIIGAFMMIFSICGGILMIPIARGENGSMRPGGFLGVLFILVAISVVYRVLQTLRAQSTLNSEANGDNNPFADILLNNGATTSSLSRSLTQFADNAIVQISAIAPPGMYSPEENGIAWSQLQRTLSSRGEPQTPVIFNVVYIFPMWLEVFLLFFVHAPGGDHGAKLQPAAIQPGV